MGFASLYAILRSALVVLRNPSNEKARQMPGFFIQHITQPLLGKANCAASWLARCGQRWVMALRRV